MGTGEGSYEYLVFNSTLIGVAAKHGLKPLTDWGDAELDCCFDEVSGPTPKAHASSVSDCLAREQACERLQCDVSAKHSALYW